MKYRYYLLSLCVWLCTVHVFAGQTALPVPRDSIVVDSVTGDVRKYKLTDRKALKPAYWLYNYLANSNKMRSDLSYDGGFVFGPAYNVTTSFAIGGGYSAQYSFDKKDPMLRKSTINGFFQVSVKGIAAVGVEGHNYLKGDRQRFNYEFSFTHYPSSFWGIGYETSVANNEADRIVAFKQLMLKFEGDYTWRLSENLYLGPKLDFMYSHLYSTNNDALMNELLRMPNGEIQPYTLTTTGIGLSLTYDSRDFATNAYKGHYFSLQQLAFIPGLNKYGFFTTDIKYQTYAPLWKKCIMAFQVHGRFNYGNDIIPWTKLASTGNQGMGRGYFYGQYRDRNIVETQLELRQRLIWRLGFVVWAGAINIFQDFDNMYMSHTLPTYGFGLRWEFKPRVNVRVDWGFTRAGSGVTFNIGEAF